MAHYAFLNSKNIVVDVIVGIDENELIEGLDPETWYSKFRGKKCLRTSYNGNIRKNYASIGFSYDKDMDAFIPPKPFDSWLLNLDTAQWHAPVDYPKDGSRYLWDEESQVWTPLEDSAAI
jgi:hypothetical protein